MVRLLVHCHPTASQSVDKAAVEVIYSLTRALEHQLSFVRGVSQTLEARLPSLQHAVALLRF
jgi:hypothetical protein